MPGELLCDSAGAGIGFSQTLDGGGKGFVRISGVYSYVTCAVWADPLILTNPFSSPASGICLGSKMMLLHPALQAGDKGGT